MIRVVRAHTLNYCEASLFIDESGFPETHEHPRCGCLSSYKVEAKYYCKRHAQVVVFSLTLEENKRKTPPLSRTEGTGARDWYG